MTIGLTLDLDGSKYEKLNKKIKNKEEICEELKRILSTNQRLFDPYDDTQPLLDLRKQHDDQITFEIQETIESNCQDLVLEDDDDVEVNNDNFSMKSKLRSRMKKLIQLMIMI